MLWFALIFHGQNLSRFSLDAFHFRQRGCVTRTWPRVWGRGQPSALSSSLGSDDSSFPWWLLFAFEHFDNVSGGRFLAASYLELTVLLGYVGHETWEVFTAALNTFSFLVLSSWNSSTCSQVWRMMSRVSLNTSFFLIFFIIKWLCNLCRFSMKFSLKFSMLWELKLPIESHIGRTASDQNLHAKVLVFSTSECNYICRQGL